jgi:hypothetical protein
MSRRSSKPFFGFLYLMVHFPFVVFWKIGITGFGVGAKKRANQVGRAVFGFPIPILIVPIPFCYEFEQWLHRTFSGLNVRFYSGDGASEFFWFPVAAFVIPIMATIWAGYLFALCIVFNIDFFGHLSQFLSILQSIFG